MSPSILEHTTSDSLVLPAPRAATLRACDCGQDLETCHAGHCPRCGRTLRA